MDVLRCQLSDRSSAKGTRAGQHLLVHHGQTVLVAPHTRPTIEYFRRRVDRRQPADNAAISVTKIFQQAEVRDLHMATDEQQVAGFNIEMLKLIAFVQIIECVGRVVQVGDQRIAGDTARTLFAKLSNTSSNEQSASSVTITN